ncbi:hypothetical protein B0T14DRAFT_290682 [Immersiella caudata]|uniref:Uncharacterized protein n=1 Tax=Immersiella caudata TaxID=314043 RepID=A0AA40BUB9_9PEZI|nr:hypothetical protein B0T14DRAFT_290682 [Immersiella caudata]
MRWKQSMIGSMRLFMTGRPKHEHFADVYHRLLFLFTPERDVSDKHWNSILFSPTLHNWWGRGYFGLKYIEAVKANVQHPKDIVTLRLQFHWMSSKQRGPRSELKGSPRSREHMEADLTLSYPYCGTPESREQQEPIVAISRPETGFNVETGNNFEFHVPKQHMEKMIEAFRVQWTLIKIVAMAGGADAEAVQGAPEHPDFLDEDWSLPGIKAGFAGLYTWIEKEMRTER